MAAPPSLAGSLHSTATCALPAVAVVPPGAPGGDADVTTGGGVLWGVTGSLGPDALLVPSAFIARTVNV